MWNSKSAYCFTTLDELLSPSGESFTAKHTFCQMNHRQTDRGQIRSWPCERKAHPQFPFHPGYSDQYCGRMLNICHQTITHWWNKSMDDRSEWDKAACLLTSLLRDGEGKRKERWREVEICSSQGRRFFLLGTICFFCFVFFLSSFIVDGGQPWGKG